MAKRRTQQFKLPQGQPQPSVPSIENNFTGGLKTEFTALNFPENASTDTQNCVFSLIGDVTRRPGIDYELNFATTSTGVANQAISSFIWTNVGGTGDPKVYVLQTGGTLYFYQITNATTTSPLSTTRLGSTVTLSTFTASGGSFDISTECQYASGNGYLFVFHPNLDTFYCTYNAGTITASVITVQIRDLLGIVEAGVADNTRPGSLTAAHHYNLNNQGWTDNAAWSTSSSTNIGINLEGQQTFTVGAGLTAVSGNPVYFTGTIGGTYNGNPVSVQETMQGYVISYSGTTLVVFITFVSYPLTSFLGATSAVQAWSISSNGGTLFTFHAAANLYPSNSDIWWTFKDTTGFFNPGFTLSNTSASSSPAPKGFYILTAFNQDRSTVSGIGGLTVVSTTLRPKTGTWFQGRVWYVGPDASGFTDSIYFSQISTDPSQFGKCYQTNDPTNETLFNLLPTDGGVIRIPGCGSIYKLFPVQNGLIVFAANGVWFITGSQGIGFAANDYNITKISGVQSISSTSFVNVNGLPIFWNEEGIYSVEPSQAGSGNRTNEQYGLSVNPITLGTILSFYNSIPLQSKKFARGDYNPITYVIKWVYRSTNENGINNRYQFDRVLNLNTLHKAFYPYTISGTPSINGISYIVGSGGSTSPSPTFKYLTSSGGNLITFAEERDLSYVDWKSFDSVGVSFTSYFITAYRLKGMAQRKFQPQYIYLFNDIPTYGYTLQGIWDFALSPLSNRFSTVEVVRVNQPGGYFAKAFRKHRIRGNGYVLQFKVSSVQGQPFAIAGWSVLDTIGIQ